MFKRLISIAVISAFFCLSTATAQNTDYQMRRGVANLTVVIKMLNFAGDSQLVLNAKEANAYLFNDYRGVIYYLKRADEAFNLAGKPNLINLDGFFAVAQDMSSKMADAALKDAENKTDADKRQAAELAAAMRGLDTKTLKDKDGKFDWAAIEVAIKVYSQSRSNLDAFTNPIVPGFHYAEYLKATAASAAATQVANAPAEAAKSNFQNNNGLSITGLPNGLPATTLSLGILTTPVGGVIAFGDGGFPVVAGALDSNTLSTSGGLSAFSMGGGMDSGTNSSPTVCSVLQCFEPATVRWGVWGVGGNAIISGNPLVAMTANSQLHYLLGTATSPAQYATLTGVSTYSPVGGTTPTGINGTIYSAVIGNINVNFGANTATLANYALSGNGLNTADFTFTNVPITITTVGTAQVLSGFQTNSANNTLNTNGFFIGAAGSHLGMGFKTTNADPNFSINQVQAFKK